MQKYDYDAIIIGAGISGLVCGCYLAKAGLKTLIVEKNAKPGGYCTSFTRNGFHFDACVHSLGSLRDNGLIAEILQELELENTKIIRYNPQDVIITPDYKIHFWNELDRTVQELEYSFPKESKSIKLLFEYLNSTEGFSNVELRNKTLKDILDNYISNEKLKSILSLFTLGNLGLPASYISAFVAVKFYKQFILDGGYYLDGGMEVLPNILVRRFKELNGRIILSTPVIGIKVRENAAIGIITEKNDFISSKYIVSNCDAMQTFFNLIGEEKSGKTVTEKMHSLVPSLSMFILYLGVDKNTPLLPKEGVNTWYLSSYNMEEMYITANDRLPKDFAWFMVRIMPDRNSLLAFVNAPFKDEEYWYRHKAEVLNALIKKIELIIPGLSRYIVFKDAATPYTLYKRTLNYKGAAYGWAAIPSQFAIPELSQATPIKNLYLTGHWTTLAQGIPGVMYLGRDTARIISKKGERI